MSENEEKIRELLRFIEKERKHTGAPGNQYSQGALLALDGVQANAETVLSKLKEIQKKEGAEDAGAAGDWVYKLLRYIVRLHGVAEAAQEKAVQEKKQNIQSRTFHTYNDALIEEAKKLFPKYAQVFTFKGDLSDLNTYADFQKQQKLSRFNGFKSRKQRAVTAKLVQTREHPAVSHK